MQITDGLMLFGGLAMFLYGMSIMGSSLEKCAGNQLKSILTRLTSSRLNGFLLGLVVTAVIQSSSATTVMVVGFVNSGLMTLAQSVYIIMGANVGTSVTSWLLSLTGVSGDAWYITMLKPSSFTPVLALVGIVLHLFSKQQRKKDAAGILLGFAILMFGMETMSDAVAPLANVPQFTSIMTMFSNPIMGVLAGALLTAIIQSSSASVGILQALSLTGSISYATAIPVIMGQNIGTTVTALISSVGATKDARRASMVHLTFNIVGTLVWLTLFNVANAVFQFPFTESAITPLGIAVVHTSFNLLSTMTLMPFGDQLAALARKMVPDSKSAEDMRLLDERLFVTPSVALERAHEMLLEMAHKSMNALKEAMGLFVNYDASLAQHVADVENEVDVYEDKLGSYLVKLSSHSMSEENAHELSKYLHMIGDLERLSDHAVNLTESAQEIHDKKLEFTPETRRELHTIMAAVEEIMRYAMESLEKDDLEIASQVEPLEQVIDLINKTIRSRHIGRLTHAESTIEMGFVLSDILSNLERVADHCSNLAACLIEIANNSLDMHEYTIQVKNNQEKFGKRFEEFRERFALDSI